MKMKQILTWQVVNITYFPNYRNIEMDAGLAESVLPE
jgi:hypothetical protein